MLAFFSVLLVDHLRDLYDAELTFANALPGLIDSCENDFLRDMMLEVEHETRHTLQQLHSLSDALDIALHGKPCLAVHVYLKDSTHAEGDEAVLNCACQVAEYEATALALARELAATTGDSAAALTLNSLAYRAGTRHERLNGLRPAFEPAAN